MTVLRTEDGRVRVTEAGVVLALEGIAAPTNYELREDGSRELREDGSFELRE